MIRDFKRHYFSALFFFRYESLVVIGRCMIMYKSFDRVLPNKVMNTGEQIQTTGCDENSKFSKNYKSSELFSGK